MPDQTSKYFNCSDTERAAFEAGIKLGTLYHQFVGMPVGLRNVSEMEQLLEKAISIQPYVSKVAVRIKREMLPPVEEGYGYTSLTGNMLDARLVLKYEKSVITAEIKYMDELDYPLMYITDVSSG